MRAAVLLLVVVLAGCASGGGPSAPGPTAAGGFTPPFDPPSEVDPQVLEPLAGVGPCTATPGPALDEPRPRGLVVPPEAVLTSVEEADPLVNVQGYVPWTPVQFRVWLQFVADVEVLQIEDEIREAEALVSDGTHRMFVKAQAICEMGSVFIAVIAPELEGADLPTPAGTGR